MAPEEAQREIKSFLQSVIDRLEANADLDTRWRTEGVARFSGVAADLSEVTAHFDEPFRLAVVGEFNSGKSALINALLGREDLLIMGATPTTGVVTELRWTDGAESGTVTSATGEEIFSGPVGQAVRYTDQRAPQGKLVTGVGTRVTLRVDIPMLRNLVILDTPGLGANATDDDVTTHELRNADAAVLTVSARRAGGGEATGRLAERLRVLGRKMIVAVTWIDQVDDRDAVCNLAAQTFAGVADGEAIGFASLNVLAAQRTLAACSDRSSPEAEQATQVLLADGYASLRSRVEAELQLGRLRSDLALRDAGRDLASLRRRSQAEAELATKDVESIKDQLGAAELYVQDVLLPKGQFVSAKIDEIVQLRVDEYMSALNGAIDLFIDSLSSKGLSLGVRALRGKLSARYRAKLEDDLAAEFKAVFPPDRYEVMVRQISRSVNDLVAYEWRTQARLGHDDRYSFDPGAVATQVSNELAKLTAMLGGEALAWIASLFIPGAALIGAVMMTANVGSEGRTQERIMLAKQTAKSRLANEAPQLAERQIERFRLVSDAVRDELIDTARQSAPQLEQQQKELLEAAGRWKDVAADLDRLIDAGGEQARHGAGR